MTVSGSFGDAIANDEILEKVNLYVEAKRKFVNG